MQEPQHERRLDPVLQGSPALLEGELPDRRGAGTDGGDVPARLPATRWKTTSRFYDTNVPHGLPDPRPGDDEHCCKTPLPTARPASSRARSPATSSSLLLTPRRTGRGSRPMWGGRGGGVAVGAGGCCRHGLVHAVHRAGATWAGCWPSRCWAWGLMGTLGLIAWAEYVRPAAGRPLQNFIIMPMTFVGRVLFGAHAAPVSGRHQPPNSSVT